MKKTVSASPWLNDIPKPKEILEEVIKELNERENFEDKVKKGVIKPSQAARILEEECRRKYLEYEDKVREKWRNVRPKDLEKSLIQSRAARAGDTVEMIIGRLLSIQGIPHERKVWYPGRNGEQLDIVIPNKNTLLNTPEKAIIISVKRKVRERWREVVGEAYILRCVHRIPDNIWFITVTCDVSKYAVSAMVKLNIRVYVPDNCYEEFKEYGARSLSKMFDDICDFMEREGIKKSIQKKLFSSF